MKVEKTKQEQGLRIDSEKEKARPLINVMVCPDCGCRLVPSSGCAYCPCCGWSMCS